MKNTFYFMLKTLFVLEIFTFLSLLFGYVEKQLDKKAMVNFKIFDVTEWETNNNNIYQANISRSRGNQTMKFDQLTECNMRNIFLQKSYTKYGGETISRPFYKTSKLNISLDQKSEIL